MIPHTSMGIDFDQERGWANPALLLDSFLKFPLSQLKLFVKDEEHATGMFDSV